jgi:hypothetical protein
MQSPKHTSRKSRRNLIGTITLSDLGAYPVASVLGCDHRLLARNSSRDLENNVKKHVRTFSAPGCGKADLSDSLREAANCAY